MTDKQRWQALALTALIGVALYLLAPVLTPFAVAALFAYLGDPIVDALQRRGLGRGVSVGVVFAIWILSIVVTLLLLVPFTEHQIENLLAALPHWVAWFQTKAAPWLQTHFGLAPDFLETDKIVAMLQENWHAAGGMAATIVAGVSKSGLAVIAWIVHLVLIPVVTFYLLRDWDELVARVHELIPRSVEPIVTQLVRESDAVLSAFVRGQLSVMLVMGVIYGVCLWAIGIDVGPLIGMLAGLISFVPYLGAIIGVAAGVIAALVQYQDWWHVIGVLIIFTVGHLIEGYVLVPRLVGDKIGLHPVAVMFAILAGGELFGFLGVLLALPIASVVMVLLRHAHAQYMRSGLYAAETGGATSAVIDAGGIATSSPIAVVASDPSPLPPSNSSPGP